jgi:hypothetical protein
MCLEQKEKTGKAMSHRQEILKPLKLNPHEHQQEVRGDSASQAADMGHQLGNITCEVLIEIIGKQSGLKVQDHSHLAITCSRFRTLFQPMVSIKKLLQHIAYGEQEAAEKMIDADPRLLMMSDTVVDYSHPTIIDVTPAQLAFGGDDEVMCAMLKEKLCVYSATMHQHREWGEIIFSNQIRAKFPDDDAKAEQQAAAEFDELMAQLLAAINDPLANLNEELNHAQNESPLRNLLNKFRAKFAPGEIRMGKHFNVQLLLKALEIYDANYERFGVSKFQLFWSQVVGYLERLLPVSYVQAGCQGLNKVIKGEPLKRELALFFPNTSYYPLDADHKNRLGFNHGVYFCQMGRRANGGWIGNEWIRLLGKLISTKNLKLAELVRPHQEEKTSRPINK